MQQQHDVNYYLSAEYMDTLLAFADPTDRAREIAAAKLILRPHRLVSEFNRVWKLHCASRQREARLMDFSPESILMDELAHDENGKPLKTIKNFEVILTGDDRYAGKLLYNEFTGKKEIIRDGVTREMTDDDLEIMRGDLESRYRLYDRNRLNDALSGVFRANAYNPLTELLRGLEWDGKHRIGSLLIDYYGAEDNDYTREAERLMFHSGIKRFFEPGCKADTMVVLVGAQGTGKSTFVRMLAMEDRFYRSVAEFEGQRGIEAIKGAAVCEVSEMLALKRSKDANAVKEYLTRQEDTYRAPYQRYTQTDPRRCIFVGTTNTEQFLSDPTGGRRFLPVQVAGCDMLHKRDALAADIRQAWAEAVALYDSGKVDVVENPALLAVIRQKQEEAQEDDWRVGMIGKYLKDNPHAFICTRELWEYALQMTRDPTKRDLAELGAIMQQFPEWQREEQRFYLARFGRQRVWSHQKSAAF